MKKIAIYAAIIITSISLFSSCATIFTGTKQKVQITSTPSGAKVTAKGQSGITPCVLKVKKGSSLSLQFEKDGQEGTVQKDGTWNPVTLIGIIGFWPIVFDAMSPAWYKYPSSIHYDFSKQEKEQPVPVPKEDPTIRAGEATQMVTRDNPGGTALERTIIRWNFDSDPRGTRIFWRVISSVPDEVKNTNELYLTTTPYEETRSFNILGLTYENSRDVTIEIKMTRKGYYDQVKRYNVRQAIDQQEISGFFEMVENDQ